MFELNQLKQLLTIAEAGTVSKAAENLHLSQPALSRSIQRLEEELQVTLFSRQKNKITLNKNGELAVEYARKILDDAENMCIRLQAFERSQHTISIASNGPAPLWQLSPALSKLYPDMTIQSEIKNNDQLIEGLLKDTYQVIINTSASLGQDILSIKYVDEHLSVALPPAHPLAMYKELTLRDLNGQSMLILSKIGFWYDICKEKMPDSLFLAQDDMEVLNELRRSSALPFFITDLAGTEEMVANRIVIPLMDPEVNVTFYCHIKKSDTHRLKRLISDISTFY